jgi:hypothetical protein
MDPQGTTWTGFGLFDTCPPGTTALYTKTNSGSAAYQSDCLNLLAGTYYLMVDTWPSPACIPAFTMTIEACEPPTGRCCYDGGYQCAEVTSSECVALGGAWDVTKTCAEPCPIAPDNDTCQSAFEICCGSYKEGTTIGTLVDGGVPSCVDQSDGSTETPNKEVWYTFIGTGQEMTIHTCGSTEDTIIAVYEGTCGNLVCVNADDDTPYCDDRSLQSSVTICTETLKRYFVAVWDYGANAPIDFMIGIDCGGLCSLGACCMPTGCEQTFEMNCTGAFLGIGTDCSECPVFECTGTPEAEVCGDDTNGGCNAETGFPVELVDINTTLCGTIWADGDTRDTDWYQITLTEASIVELTFMGEYPAVAGFIGNATGPVATPINCADANLQLNPYATAAWMEEGVVTTACLPAGSYVFFVSATVYEGYPCDNGYKVEVSASACRPGPRNIRPTGMGLFGGAVQQAVNGQLMPFGINSTSDTLTGLAPMQPGQVQMVR